MSDTVIEVLQRAVTAAQTYVDIVNNPHIAPLHKAVDAERRAFDELQEAVGHAVDALKNRPAGDPEAEGAWS